MKEKINLTVLVLALILCCLVPLIDATYGFFEQTISTENHLVAGSLKATLVRKKLVSYNIDNTGRLSSVTDEQEKDFTRSTGDNIFGVDGTTFIVPGSSFTAEMKLSNNGDVAFYYYIEVFFNSIISDNAFASMLKLSVVTEKGVEREILIKDGLTLGSDEPGIGLIEVGGAETFTVKLEFLDDSKNNDVQNKFVMFDLRVHAIQKVDAD